MNLMNAEKEMPADAAFTQKANAIMKAAGIASNTITVEQLRLGASVIFIRAYEAIYKTVIRDKIITPLNKLDHAENAEMLIEALREKTGNTLQDINGIDIADGDYKAIGIMVGLLFAEGQRLWAEKIKQKKQVINTDEHDNAAQPKGVNFKSNRNLKKASDKKSRLQENTLDSHSSVAEEAVNDFYDKKTQVAPGELQMLMDRIQYLETKLKDHTDEIYSDSSFPKKKSIKMKKRAKKNGVPEPLFPRDSPSNANRPFFLRSTKASQGDDSPMSDDDINNSNNYNRYSNDSYPYNEKKKRPSSAPARRAKAMIAESKSNSQHDDDAAASHNQSPSSKEAVKEVSMYTYDLQSGRKIRMSEAEAEMIRRRMNRENTGPSNRADDKMKSESNQFRRIRPSKIVQQIISNAPISSSLQANPPAFPCVRIEKSVEQWVKKSIESRKSEQGIKEHEPAKPKMFGAYQKLENLDLVISIEHCHNCEFHNISLRHDPDEYITCADSFLRGLSKLAHESKLCARVGVTRFKANITPRSKISDVDSRIGAFEIQVAYRSMTGYVHAEVLHSKLASRRWPAKFSLEKRFKTYIANIGATIFDSDLDPGLSEYTDVGSDGLAEYPVGFGPWDACALSSVDWSYPTQSTVKNIDLNTSDESAENNNNSNNKIPNILWVFDSRDANLLPKFSIGSTVLVNNVINPKGSIERHGLLGVIKQSYRAEDKVKMVSVKLKYYTQELAMPEEACLLLSQRKKESYLDKTTIRGSAEVPGELAVLLDYAIQLSCNNWLVQEPDDRKILDNNGVESILLCRNSFFNQIRNVQVIVEREFKAKGGYKVLDACTNKWLDIQLAYSEDCIDQVFNIFGGRHVDMKVLERMTRWSGMSPRVKSPSKPLSATSTAVVGQLALSSPRSDGARNVNNSCNFNDVDGNDSMVHTLIHVTNVIWSASADSRGGETGKEFVENLMQNENNQVWNKWSCANHVTGIPGVIAWVEQAFFGRGGDSGKYIAQYKLSTAGDHPERDPTGWIVKGLVHNTDYNWIELHRVDNSSNLPWASNEKNGSPANSVSDDHNRYRWVTFDIPENLSRVKLASVRLEISCVRGGAEAAGVQLGHWHLFECPREVIEDSDATNTNLNSDGRDNISTGAFNRYDHGNSNNTSSSNNNDYFNDTKKPLVAPLNINTTNESRDYFSDNSAAGLGSAFSNNSLYLSPGGFDTHSNVALRKETYGSDNFNRINDDNDDIDNIIISDENEYDLNIDTSLSLSRTINEIPSGVWSVDETHSYNKNNNNNYNNNNNEPATPFALLETTDNHQYLKLDDSMPTTINSSILINHNNDKQESYLIVNDSDKNIIAAAVNSINWKVPPPLRPKSYQARAIEFAYIELEGACLSQSLFDYIYVNILLQSSKNDDSFISLKEKSYHTSISSSAEIRSTKRIFHTKWPQLELTDSLLEHGIMKLSILEKSEDNLSSSSLPPTLLSGEIPLYYFMKDCGQYEPIELILESLKGANVFAKCTLQVFISESVSEAKSRIEKMLPKQLASIKFEPLPDDDDMDNCDTPVIESSNHVNHSKYNHTMDNSNGTVMTAAAAAVTDNAGSQLGSSDHFIPNFDKINIDSNNYGIGNSNSNSNSHADSAVKGKISRPASATRRNATSPRPSSASRGRTDIPNSSNNNNNNNNYNDKSNNKLDNVNNDLSMKISSPRPDSSSRNNVDNVLSEVSSTLINKSSTSRPGSAATINLNSQQVNKIELNDNESDNLDNHLVPNGPITSLDGNSLDCSGSYDLEDEFIQEDDNDYNDDFDNI